MPNFAEKVEMAVDALSQNPTGDIDENEFIDASRLVYDGVRDIRQAVLMNRVCVCHVKRMESALMLYFNNKCQISFPNYAVWLGPSLAT